MKLEGLDHPKTLDLCAQLHIELPAAIGHLELLWAFTGKKAPQGNVGKFPDGAIAVACFWRGEPADFINGLVAARLLDKHGEHRLVVHDWHEHAPNWVKAKLSKAKLGFLNHPGVSASVSAGISDGVSGDAENDTGSDAATDTRSDTPTDTRSSRARVLPSEVKPSEGKTSALRARETTDTGSDTATDTGRERKVADAAAQMSACGALCIELRKHGVTVSSMNPLLVAWVQEKFPLDRILGAVAKARDTLGDDQPIRPQYLDTILRAPPRKVNGSVPRPSNGEPRTHAQVMAALDAVTDWSKPEFPEDEPAGVAQ